MRNFPGFPSRPDYVAIPRVFFTDVLPSIQDLGELLVTLHLFRLLGAKRGYPRAVAYDDLLADRPLVAGFSELGRDFRQEIQRGLDAAAARGTFLRVSRNGGQEWVMLNTPQDRRAADALRRGEVSPSRAQVEGAAAPVGLPTGPAYRTGRQAGLPQRDIFTLYEETIGMLTPLLAERLQEAEKEYPAEWLQEAFLIAVEHNHRQWRYVERILERWKVEGKDDGTSRGHPTKTRDVGKYFIWPDGRSRGE